jgi:hypothetical protein
LNNPDSSELLFDISKEGVIMADEGFKRIPCAILSADFRGYSRLIGWDKNATIRTLTTYQWPFS